MFQKKIKCFGMMQAKPGLRGPRADEDVEDVFIRETRTCRRNGASCSLEHPVLLGGPHSC